MKSLQPPMDPRSRERLPGDLDQMLSDYYRAEMPRPWPAFKPPAERETVAKQLPVRPRPWFGSRFALAASLLLLLLGHLTLSGMFSDRVATSIDQSGTKEEATNRNRPTKMKKSAPARPGNLKQSGHLFTRGAILT